MSHQFASLRIRVCILFGNRCITDCVVCSLAFQTCMLAKPGVLAKGGHSRVYNYIQRISCVDPALNDIVKNILSSPSIFSTNNAKRDSD